MLLTMNIFVQAQLNYLYKWLQAYQWILVPATLVILTSGISMSKAPLIIILTCYLN